MDIRERMKQINEEVALLYEEAGELSKLWNLGIRDTEGKAPDNVLQGPWGRNNESVGMWRQTLAT